MKILSGMSKPAPPKRATRRISMCIRFLVYGRDDGGFGFKTAAATSVVTGQGGCLVLDDVSEGQNLKLRSENGKIFSANVRWCAYDPMSNRRYVGFKVLGETNEWARNVVSYLEWMNFKPGESIKSEAAKLC